MLTSATPSGDAVSQEFEDLFRDNFQLVYRTAYTVTGKRQDAEDVVQTVFLRLFSRNSLASVRQNPKGYLYRAAINESLNILRTHRRIELTSNINLLDRVCQPMDAADSSEKLEKAVMKAISQLHPSAVEVLILRYEHNQSDAEIAKLLGKSRGTVAVMLFRARRRLKKILSSALKADL